MVPACSEERVIEFPRFGKKKLWNMGHSEPLTFLAHLNARGIRGFEDIEMTRPVG